MSEMSEKLGNFLSKRFEQMNREEGRTYDDPLTWRELAKRCKLKDGGHIPENNLLRWKDGLNVPSNPEQTAALANVFGAHVLVVLDIIDEDIAFLIDHLNDPRVQPILEEVHEVAKQSKKVTIDAYST